MLKLIVDQLNATGSRVVTLDAVRRIEEEMVADGPAFDAQFAVLISDYSADEVLHAEEARLGKGTLALIAKLGQDQVDAGRDEGWVRKDGILEQLQRQRIPEEKAIGLLSQLHRTRIVEEANREGGLCYRLTVPLLRKRFVRQNIYLKYFR